MQHRPVEDGAGGAPVAVGEVVVVAHHEMQSDGAQERRHVWAVVFRAAVGEGAQRLHAPGQFLGRWRYVEDLVLILCSVDPDSLLPGALDPTGVGRIVQCAGGNSAVDLAYQLGTQGVILEGDDLLHGPVVVEDHLLAAVLWIASFAQHLLGAHPGGGGALQLRGGDRLLGE